MATLVGRAVPPTRFDFAADAELARRLIPLASNQVEYSLLHRDPKTDGVLDACRELGVTLIPYMPLASGALTGKYSATTRPAAWRRYTRYFHGKNLGALNGLVDLLREIGTRYDRSPGQVALRWLIQQDGVLPIPGANALGRSQRADGTVIDVLKVAVFVLVVLLVLLGLPLGMPMAGTSMCPDDDVVPV